MPDDADPVEWCLQPEPIDSMTTYSIFGTSRFEWTARVMPTKWLARRAEISDLSNLDGTVGDNSDPNTQRRRWGLSLVRVDLFWHIGTSQVKFCQNFPAFQFTWSLRFSTAIPVFSMSLLDDSDICSTECDPEALLVGRVYVCKYGVRIFSAFLALITNHLPFYKTECYFSSDP